MKLTEDDFNFLVYSSSLERDANIDRVNQLKQQFLSDNKLRERIEKRIEDFKDSSEGIDIILQKLLEDSKNEQN